MPEALQNIGYQVDLLTEADLEQENLTTEQLVAEPPNGFGLPIKVEKIFEIIKKQKEY